MMQKTFKWHIVNILTLVIYNINIIFNSRFLAKLIKKIEIIGFGKEHYINVISMFHKTHMFIQEVHKSYRNNEISANEAQKHLDDIGEMLAKLQ